MSAIEAKGPIVHQGRLSVSAGVAKGYLTRLDKMRGVHDKSLVSDSLG